jgi:hypothetical protein
MYLIISFFDTGRYTKIKHNAEQILINLPWQNSSTIGSHTGEDNYPRRVGTESDHGHPKR